VAGTRRLVLVTASDIASSGCRKHRREFVRVFVVRGDLGRDERLFREHRDVLAHR